MARGTSGPGCFNQVHRLRRQRSLGPSARVDGEAKGPHASRSRFCPALHPPVPAGLIPVRPLPGSYRLASADSTPVSPSPYRGTACRQCLVGVFAPWRAASTTDWSAPLPGARYRTFNSPSLPLRRCGVKPRTSIHPSRPTLSPQTAPTSPASLLPRGPKPGLWGSQPSPGESLGLSTSRRRASVETPLPCRRPRPHTPGSGRGVGAASLAAPRPHRGPHAVSFPPLRPRCRRGQLPTLSLPHLGRHTPDSQLPRAHRWPFNQGVTCLGDPEVFPHSHFQNFKVLENSVIKQMPHSHPLKTSLNQSLILYKNSEL